MKKIYLTLLISILFPFFANAKGPAEFNMATYNLRMPAKSDFKHGDTWAARSPRMADLIRFHEFNIFGTQEGFRWQLDSLKSMLPGYDFIGVAREDGKEKGEHSAIFYDTNMFQVLDHGDFWLSETPDKPGLGWDAACIRICTWGKFRHKPSGKDFLYFNLHMDHVGKKARIESVKVIEEKIKEFGSKLPIFLSGDFNVDQNNECYKFIVDSGIFQDSYELANVKYAPNGTFNAWRPAVFSKSRIDHIFVTPGVKVRRYGILTDTYRSFENVEGSLDADDSFKIKLVDATIRMPSDHFPVMITATLPEK